MNNNLLVNWRLDTDSSHTHVSRKQFINFFHQNTSISTYRPIFSTSQPAAISLGMHTKPVGGIAIFTYFPTSSWCLTNFFWKGKILYFF